MADLTTWYLLEQEGHGGSHELQHGGAGPPLQGRGGEGLLR